MFDVEFANKEYLYLLIAIPVLLLAFAIYMQRRKAAMRKIGNMKVLKPLMPESSTARPILRMALAMLALSLIIIAVARPRVGSKLVESTSEGSEIMIVMDISNSMRATDIYPSRLENTKNAISNMLKKLENDRVGLIVFAGSAFVQVPMTTDLKAIDIFVQTISCDMISEQGTAFGEALNLAMKSFNYENDLSKSIILISDGENHELTPDPFEVAAHCSRKGITIHTIGMGSPQGAPIPVRDGSNDLMTDRSGKPVVSKLDEASLQRIAKEGKGIYMRATNGNSGFNTIYNEIAKMKKGQLMQYADFEEKFVLPTVLALILYVAACLILNRKNRWIRKTGIFE